MIIDVSSKSLKILFQKSKQSLLETYGILDLFWTIRIENQFPRISQYECLVSRYEASFNGGELSARTKTQTDDYVPIRVISFEIRHYDDRNRVKSAVGLWPELELGRCADFGSERQ